MTRVLVNRCESSLQRLGRLIHEMLDDSRIHEGRLELDLEPCALSTVARDAAAEQRVLTPTREIRLVTTGQPAPVFADASRLKQVVTQYLSNALKYSREDQPVEVEVRVEGDVGRVSVCDQGVGIPYADQERVWERFQRIPGVAVQSGSGVGMGIGLHISKTIIERHLGQVGVNSAPGQGSTFWFTVPLAR
jgi:signal transduction histidine kinase